MSFPTMSTFNKLLFIVVVIAGCQQITNAGFFPSSFVQEERFLEFAEHIVNATEFKSINETFVSPDAKIAYSLDEVNKNLMDENIQYTQVMAKTLMAHEIFIPDEDPTAPWANIIDTEYKVFLNFSKKKDDEVSNEIVNWAETVVDHSSQFGIVKALNMIDVKSERSITELIDNIDDIQVRFFL